MKNYQVNELVAEKVLGLEVRNGNIVRDGKRSGIPNYTDRIEFAWRVIECFDFANVEKVTGYGDFYKVTLSASRTNGTYEEIEVRDPSITHAICIAGLRAHGIEVKSINA